MSEDAAGSLPSPASNATSNASPEPTYCPPKSSFSRPSTSSQPPSSRAINPAPIAITRVTPKVAIATAASPPLRDAHPSPLGGGPTSASYVVPPRPKPGRKPATDEPASKRKAQNRESQRAFRARKQQKLTEMQSQVESQESRHRMEMNSKISELHERETRISKLEALLAQYQEKDAKSTREIEFWKSESDSLRKQLHERSSSVTSVGAQHSGFFQSSNTESRHDSPTRQTVSSSTPMGNSPQAYGTPSTEIGCSKCNSGGHCACLEEMAKLHNASTFMPAVPLSKTPARTTSSPMKGIQTPVPVQDTAALFAEREIDFTAQFASRRNNRVDARPSIAFLTQSNDPDASCGFCTDESNCLCRDASLQNQSDLTDDLLPQARSHLVGTPNSTDGCATTGPGTCSDCVRDPKQRAWCQRVAQLKNSDEDYFSQSPRSRHSSSSGLDPIEPRTDYAPVQASNLSIGCSDAYKLFDGRVPTDQETMDWSTLKPISPSATRIDNLPGLGLPGRKYSALELDTAGVIATLQQTMGPLTPREKDGEYAPLVLKAQERRHTPV